MSNSKVHNPQPYFFAGEQGSSTTYLFIRKSVLKELEEKEGLSEINICGEFLNTKWGIDVGRAGAISYRSWNLVVGQDIKMLGQVLDILIGGTDSTTPVDTEYWEILESHGFQTRYFVARATKTQDFYLFIRKDILSDIELSKGLEYLEIAGEPLYNAWGSGSFSTVSFLNYRAVRIPACSDLGKLFKILDIATDSMDPSLAPLESGWEVR